MGLPIGQVRFDTKGDQAEINVSISSGFRGHGFGRKAIRTASERLFCETQVTRINANIKLENTASVHAFAKAGYKKIGAGIVKGQEALQMVLRKNDALSKDNSYEDQ
jgi:RimJ/RimL family protein N-acetyltransferase